MGSCFSSPEAKEKVRAHACALDGCHMVAGPQLEVLLRSGCCGRASTRLCHETVAS